MTEGVKLVKLDDGASISSITRVISEDATPSKSTEQENNDQEVSDEK